MHLKQFLFWLHTDDTDTSCTLCVHNCDTFSGLLIAVAPRYRYCSGSTFTVAVVPLILAESSGDGSAATFKLLFNAIRYCYF